MRDQTQFFTTPEKQKAMTKNVVYVRLVMSSSSSSSCTSSSSSSSCSASSSPDSLSSIHVINTNKANPLKYINTSHNDMTINETDAACSSAIKNISPQHLNLENRRLGLNRCTRGNLNYYTSPVNTDERDVDLSDSDPTFINIKPSKNRNYLINQSSSSSTSSSNSNRANAKKGRKRSKNPDQWKQNKIKRLRNTGRSYVSLAKSQKNVSSRYLKEPCTDKCRLKCLTKINTDCRYELFRNFWDLGDLAKQRAYIGASMMDIQPKYKYTNAERPRHNNKSFHFVVDRNAIRKAIEEKYDTHIKEKNYSRIEKHNDRNNINKNSRVAVYDLEAVLQCPRGDSSCFYYKSKLNCYNLTVTELTPKECNVAYKNVHCYFWSECDAKRGAIEIGSCVWAYIKSLNDEDNEEKEVIFYSDNCCGQNKNKYITSLYFHAIQTLNIKSITHKFLIRGHTQNEADSVHSLIEKEVKKNLKSGPIYTSDQYIALIKSAKKSKPPLMVHEMNFESFIDLKLLQDEWGYNFTTNTEAESVNWNNIKVLKITKENPTSFFYKSSYENQNYKEVNVRNKRKKMKPLSEITIQPAYSEKQQLSENKKKDLKDLIAKGLIPSFYAAFYNSIL
ncbi:hypothetical protein evm_015444 [Chilo suppressalis]|nr:hypothetical protein evm_015444 [Chilo suppressalis]